MKTILVIDDEEPILDTYAMALVEQGHHAITAGSGHEGLELARRHLPDLILCDINMPGMDGRAVLRAVREDPDLAAKQFVFMTGNTLDVTPRSGMELGADDFLVKPFTLQDLARCVSARLERAHVHWRVEDRIVSGLRASLHSILPHEFFTPLNGILGLTEVLRGDIESLRPEEVQELLAAIEDSGWRLHRSLRNYLLLLDLQRTGDALESADATAAALAGAALASAVRSGADAAARRHHRANDVRCSVEEEETIAGTASDVALIVEELVDNACAFSRQGTTIEVSLRATGELTVQDRGRGMTRAQIAQIGAFRQFERERIEQLVQRLTRRCGATLQVESERGVGTRVRVSFVARSRKVA
jgi:CheY-like chemotaxis protein